jgi:phage terminase large subunit-like protein
VSNTLTLTLPRPHSAQRAIKAEARRFNVVCCGRRFGKTILGEDVLIGPALEGKPVAWFSPTYKMLAEVWRDLRRVLAPVTRRVSMQEHRLELVTGGLVECWSLDSPDVARGRKYARVVVDEAAMIAGL